MFEFFRFVFPFRFVLIKTRFIFDNNNIDGRFSNFEGNKNREL